MFDVSCRYGLFEVLLGSCRLPSGFYSVPALVFDVKLWQEMQFCHRLTLKLKMEHKVLFKKKKRRIKIKHCLKLNSIFFIYFVSNYEDI